MKYILLLAVILMGCSQSSESSTDHIIGTLDGDKVKRVIDTELKVACYAASYRVLSCVKL
jgi:hypothetical protein